MKVLGISVKQIVVGIEFTPNELLQLKWFLDNSEVDYNSENEFENSAQKYVTDELYLTLEKLLKELGDDSG